MRIIFVLIISFFLCCNDRNKESKSNIEIVSTSEKTESKISFSDYIKKIPDERYPKNFSYDPSKLFTDSCLYVNANIFNQVTIPDDVINELQSNKNDLKKALKTNSFFAISKMILNDSIVSIRYQISTDNVKTEKNTYRFLATYNKKGDIISVIPTKYHKSISTYKVQCFSIFNKNNRITRYYIYEDTAKVIKTSRMYGEGNNYHRLEYAESLSVRKDGLIDTIKPVTNLIESFSKTYVKVGIEDRIYKVQKPCKDTFHIINFIPQKNSKYYQLHYKDGSKELKFEIVMSRMIGTSGIQNEFDWKYKGKYIHLWLRNIESSKYDESFLAIGTSGDSRVHEFHFPKSSDKIGFLFTDYENLLNNRIKIQKTGCDD